MQYLYIPTRKWYLYWDNIRKYHCAAWENIARTICICLPETDKFIGMRIFLIVHHREFPYVEGNTFTITVEFFINYCKLINIFSTQLWFVTHTHAKIHAHTHTAHAYITKDSIFISELLSLKPGVLLFQ